MTRGDVVALWEHVREERLFPDVDVSANGEIFRDAIDSLDDPDYDFVNHYVVCRIQGASPRLADMLASQQPPLTKGDKTFLRGRFYDQQEMLNGNPVLSNHYTAEAKKAGVSTTGKVYSSAVAEYPGDPRAWVESRSDVERVCRERGWSCDGDVTVKNREVQHVHDPAD